MSDECSSIFFFNDTATTEIYTLSLHDALPISRAKLHFRTRFTLEFQVPAAQIVAQPLQSGRSEEHTSELQSQSNLVCRLLLEKKINLTHLKPRLPNGGKYNGCIEPILHLTL